MKTFIFLAALAVLAIATPEEDLIYQNYLETFNIRVGRSTKAKENVLKKHRECEEHNAKYRKGEATFTAALNEFSWKTDEEFVNQNLGFIDGPQNNASLPLPEGRTGRSLPDYFNWVDRGVVRPVQNQGGCGSCYAFAGIGAIEAVSCIKLGQCSKLSEQEAMECTNLCSGGWDDWVYNYAYSKSGCTTSSYSYVPYRLNNCDAAAYRSRVSKTSVTGWYNLHGYGEATIRSYLQSQGPMFVAFDVYNNFNYYSSGIYSSVSGSKLGGHAVLLVGWGQENGIPYWILKNSWGTGWGEKGYFRMRRGINLANIETWRVSVPVTA